MSIGARTIRPAALGTTLGAALLLGSGPAAAQTFEAGLALTDADVGELAVRSPPEHDLPPPPGLERMSVSQALQEHLASWISGDLPREEIELQIHAFHLQRGRVAERLRPGSAYRIGAGGGGGTGTVSLKDAPQHDIPLPPELATGKFEETRVAGYDLAARPVPVGDALGDPGRLILDGIFDASRELRLGDVLYFVAVPTDRELRSRARGRVMLVMF